MLDVACASRTTVVCACASRTTVACASRTTGGTPQSPNSRPGRSVSHPRTLPAEHQAVAFAAGSTLLRSSLSGGGRPFPDARGSMELAVCQLGTQELLGFVAFRLGSRQLSVGGLVVAMECRRCGVGSLLLRLVGRIVRRANATEVVVVGAVTSRVLFYARAPFNSAPRGSTAEDPPLIRRLDRLLRRL